MQNDRIFVSCSIIRLLIWFSDTNPGIVSVRLISPNQSFLFKSESEIQCGMKDFQTNSDRLKKKKNKNLFLNSGSSFQRSSITPGLRASPARYRRATHSIHSLCFRSLSREKLFQELLFSIICWPQGVSRCSTPSPRIPLLSFILVYRPRTELSGQHLIKIFFFFYTYNPYMYFYDSSTKNRNFKQN